MSDNNSRRSVIEIDPSFFRPPNVIDVRYALGDKDETTSLEEYTVGENVSEVINDLDPAAEEGLPIPETVTIVSQKVRVNEGGGYFVDVVIDVENIPGVESFDLSVTRL